jgi:ribonuclease-3
MVMNTRDDLLSCIVTSKGNVYPITSWDALRNSLVDNTALAQRGLDLGLDAFIVTNPGTNASRSPNMVARAFEAIIGAVFLDAGDQGLQAVHDVLEHIGFFDHPMLSVTSLRPPILCFETHTVVN